MPNYTPDPAWLKGDRRYFAKHPNRRHRLRTYCRGEMLPDAAKMHSPDDTIEALGVSADAAAVEADLLDCPPDMVPMTLVSRLPLQGRVRSFYQLPRAALHSPTDADLDVLATQGWLPLV